MPVDPITPAAITTIPAWITQSAALPLASSRCTP
jgi:hypothetical protein